MAYIDAFVMVVPTKKLDAYKKMSTKAGRVWREHGAVDYWECAGDDLGTKFGRPFPKLLKLKDDETAVFSWILYNSKAQRTKVNAKVMNDERINKMMDPKDMPFDMKKMTMGGFKSIVHVAGKK